MAVLAFRTTRKPVASIDLNAGLCGVNLHHAACIIMRQLGGKAKFVLLNAVDDPATVVTLSINQVGEVFLDVAANQFGLGEIHRSINHLSHFASRDQFFGGGQEARGVQMQFMVEDVAVAFAF